MVKNILSTTGTRILNAIVNLVILIILTNGVGSEGFGVITIIIVALTVIQLFIDLIAGSTLWGNIVGFIITIAFAIILIPAFGFIGAACTASASYTSTVIYQYYIFRKETGTTLNQWLIVKSDIHDFITIAGKLIKRS